VRKAHRLLVAGTQHERALLRAGASEAPTEESVRAAARVVGLVPRAAVFAYLTAVVAKAVKWSWLHAYVLAPALAFGAMSAEYAVTMHRSGEIGRVVLREGTLGSALPLRAVSRPTPEAVSALLSPVEPIAAGPTPAVHELGSTHVVAAKGSERARGSSRAVVYGASSDALQEQVGLVDRARSLLASGDASGALHAVDAYEHRFPTGILLEEASLLRIQAIAARGDRAAAAALAQRFSTVYPRSVHTDTIQSLMGNGSN
jgi:hypothetical protein